MSGTFHYNEDLADRILEVLHNSYPSKLHENELWQALPEFSELEAFGFEWRNALFALKQDGLVDKTRFHRGLTPKGREQTLDLARLEELGDRLFKRTILPLYEDVDREGAQILADHAFGGLSHSSPLVNAIYRLVLERFRQLPDSFRHSYIEPCQQSANGVTKCRERWLRRTLDRKWTSEKARALAVAERLAHGAMDNLQWANDDFTKRSDELKTLVLNEIEIAALASTAPGHTKRDAVFTWWHSLSTTNKVFALLALVGIIVSSAGLAVSIPSAYWSYLGSRNQSQAVNDPGKTRALPPGKQGSIEGQPATRPASDLPSFGARTSVSVKAEVTRLIPITAGPKILLSYEWHSDGSQDADSRKLELLNDGTEAALNVRLDEIRSGPWAVRFPPIPLIEKGRRVQVAPSEVLALSPDKHMAGPLTLGAFLRKAIANKDITQDPSR